MKQLLLLLIIPLMLNAGIFEQNAKLSRTLNLGNYLEAPNEGDWGSILTEEDFPRIAEKGFTAVRIPVRWSNHIDNDTLIDPVFMNRVKWAIDNAVENGLVVVVDDHHFEGLMKDPDANEPVMKTIWRQVADSLKNYSEDSLFFEPVNEPHSLMDSNRWNRFLVELISVIRETNPTRPLVIGTTGWGGVAGLFDLKLPNDPNLIATVHYYSPFQFTHQGAEWSSGSKAWLGTEWSGDFFEKDALYNDLLSVKEWSDEKGIPVFVGEFGAYSKADLSSRLRWTHFTARVMESLELPWAYWEYSAGFGVYDPAQGKWRDELVDTLLSNDTKTLNFDSSDINFGEEQIRNGDFSGGDNEWFHNVWGDNADASIQLSGDTLIHTVNTPGAEFYQIQLLQKGHSLKKGKKYLFQVNATGDDVSKMALSIMREDYSSVAGTGEKIVKSGGSSISAFITPAEDEMNLTAALNLGYVKGEIKIHSVSLREIETGESSIKTDVVKKSDLSISIQSGTISLAGNLPSNSSLKLFSIRGRQLLSIDKLNGTQISLPKHLGAGWYGVVISNEGRNLLRQAIILK